MRKCPWCGSVWVCWNWVHFDGSYSEVGHLYNSDKLWIHECWDCENTITTVGKVHNGIWYWALKMFYKEKVK